ncbi:hypothetical protein D3C75_743120 [compost metagenome]
MAVRVTISRKPEETFSTCRPCWVTGRGRRDSTTFRRFCTSTWARSGWVPGAKVAVMVALPRLLCDSKYSRLSAPLSSCSIRLTTLSSMVAAEAPGYTA